ncbi:hypothetical protein SAMN05444274_106256 [Mariniphaga anaerophila]|uniref:ASCH domain-containing protein n=1 Tax=Mariniphaga anaerophila TaxID=1484053 RepID=A0A1M5CTA4_9BACT|nr:hypothetical protein [Mariniphaga anaerophila]SHF57969.1 hypothetical protein SAMN05444274_106256 [Mariniphaga anaerophila]
MKHPKILYLTLKKEFFDQIKRGDKTSEFREYKKYWVQRLMDADGRLIKYDFVVFRNGYHKSAQKMTVEFKGIKITRNRTDWFRHKKYFEIELGKITQ